MEYCEFFFGNFWHYLGLWFIVATIFSTPIIKIIKKKDRDE